MSVMPDEPLYMRVRNWHKFQHYTPGSRPVRWIKNYLDLDEPGGAFTNVSFADQGRLQAIFRLAARHNNLMPYDERWVCRALRAKSLPLGRYLADKWIQIGTRSELEKIAKAEKRAANRKKRASKPLAERKQDASLEGEGEEREREIPRAVAPVRTLLPVDSENGQYIFEWLLWIGRDADAGTLGVINSFAKQLPEAALAKIERSRKQAKPNDRAEWIVGALKSEISERSAA